MNSKEKRKSFIHTSMPKSWHESDFTRVAVVSVAGGNNCSQYKRQWHVVFAAGRDKEYLKIYETHDLERMFRFIFTLHTTVEIYDGNVEMNVECVNIFYFSNLRSMRWLTQNDRVFIDFSHSRWTLKAHIIWLADQYLLPPVIKNASAM